MTEGTLNSLLVRVVPRLIALIMRVWFLTCRVKVHGLENWRDPNETGQPIIASFWHYSLLFIFYYMRDQSGAALVSASRDGEYVARLAHEFNFATVRGSRNNKGVEALKGLLRVVRAGDSVALVADGSQGPARIAQSGAILLASRTGTPIQPLAWSASRYFTIRSWDRTAVPKPFSRVEYFFGEPIIVPPELKAEGIEEYRLLLENRLNELYRSAWGQYNKDGH
ncbi:MAG TPA: hypothetical protein DDY32_03685 [Desulfobulbaceae bacterium]|nr:hypothetical protein [Desulfobulbaceae bacterium]